MLNNGVPLRGVLCAYLGVDLLSGAAAVRDQQETLLAFVNVIGSNHLNSHHISEMLCLVLHSQGHCVAEQR